MATDFDSDLKLAKLHTRFVFTLVSFTILTALTTLELFRASYDSHTVYVGPRTGLLSL